MITKREVIKAHNTIIEYCKENGCSGCPFGDICSGDDFPCSSKIINELKEGE